jgi:hypothetical protein
MTLARGLGPWTLLAAAAAIAACQSSAPEASTPQTPLPPEGARAWLSEVARSCALVASCAHTHDAPLFGDPATCADWWLTHPPGERDAVHACLLAARTCDAVDACTREHGDARAAAYCASHAGVLTGCDGDRFVTCTGDDTAESTAVDCAALSGKCRENNMPGGLLVRACFSAALCPATAPDARCDGKKAIVSCHDGAVERTACPEGTRCEEHQDADGDRTASCESPRHERCSDPGARYCAGDRLVTCEPRGHFGDVRVTDCATFGMRCAGVGPRASCVSPTPECTSAPARCDGEAITFCAGGSRVRVSCASIGLGACDPDAHGAQAGCSRAR